jgi:hypothetical protein
VGTGRGEYRAIYLNAVFDEYFEGPFFVFCYGKTGGTKVFYLLPGNVFQSFNGIRQIFFKFCRGLLLNQLVHAGVGAYLVTARNNFFYYFGVGLSYPTQAKKSSFGVGAFQYSKNALHVLMDTHFVIFPFIDGFGRFIIEYVKPLFDVESEYVHALVLFNYFPMTIFLAANPFKPFSFL